MFLYGAKNSLKVPPNSHLKATIIAIIKYCI